MRLSLLSAASLVALAALFAGCPQTPKEHPDNQQQCKATSRSCAVDRDCAGGFCDKTNDSPDGTGDGIAAADDPLGCCVKLVCTSNADCQANEKCDLRKEICIPKNLCDPSQANGGKCTDDSGALADCCQAGELCVYNEGTPSCTASPPPASKCFVAAGGRPIAQTAGANATSPDGDGNFPAAVASGTLQLEAVGTDDNGKNVPDAVFTWSGDGVDSATGIFTPPACATGICQSTVTATSGGASCTGVVNVYAPATAGSTRIVILDVDTGAPLSGVDAAAVADGTVTAGTTDGNGAAEFTGTVTAISAFPAGYQWHTIVGPPDDVVVYTKKVPDNTKVAGIKGVFDFSKVHTTGDIKLGLAGTAISSAITDLNFTTLIGEIAKYNVNIEGITQAGGQLVPLPSGIEIDLGTTPIKGDYVTFGDPGRNIGWALGGEIALADIGPVISGVAGGGDVDVGNILAGVLPFFGKFDHAVVTGLDLSETTRPQADPNNPDAPIPTDQWQFPEENMQPNTLLSQSAVYTVPQLPCSPGNFAGGTTCSDPGDGTSGYQTGAVLLAGVVVPGVGIVPLGLTAGLDDPDTTDGAQFDGQIDTKDASAGLEKGQGRIDYAPPHDGLEGNTFITVALALDLNQITSSKGLGTSIVAQLTKGYTPEPGTNSFPAAAFLQSQGGAYTPDDGTGNAGSFQMNAIGNADFFRLNVHDDNDQEWNIWFADATDAANVHVTDFVPAALQGDAGARFKTANVQAFKLGAGYGQSVGAPEPSTFGDLFAFNGTNLDNLLYYLGAWSSQACKADGTCIDSSQQ